MMWCLFANHLFTFTGVLVFEGFLNTLTPVFQSSNIFGNLFSDALCRFLLFKISDVEIFKKPWNTNTHVFI